MNGSRHADAMAVTRINGKEEKGKGVLDRMVEILGKSTINSFADVEPKQFFFQKIQDVVNQPISVEGFHT
jgi:hypothetical protein